MAISLQQFTNCLREAIKNYPPDAKAKLNPQELALLERLGEDQHFLHAFRRLKIEKPNELIPVLHACLVANQLARTFRKRVAAENALLASIDDLKRAVGKLDKFVFDRSKRGFVWRGAIKNNELNLVRCEPEEFTSMSSGLTLIASLIEGARYTASTVDLWLGTTRNTNQKVAKENVAIWQLAQAVRRVTSLPHTRAVAEISGSLLGTPVTEDRVRGVVRKRRKMADK